LLSVKPITFGLLCTMLGRRQLFAPAHRHRAIDLPHSPKERQPHMTKREYEREYEQG
jgi:hypothetical protein